MSSKSPAPLNEEQQKQLRSAFYDLESQLRQASETLKELRKILFHNSTRKTDVITDEEAWAAGRLPYSGPIGVGDHFIWMKDNPRAWAHVTVFRIDFEDSKGVRFDERRIWTRTVGTKVADPINQIEKETWNDEGHFREAVIACDPNGVET
jgi:hypothetical protein